MDGSVFMKVIKGPCAHGLCVLYVEGPLRAPVDTRLRHTVHSLLRRGVRTIVLDLTRVSNVDAAGVSELVRAYNLAVQVKSAVQIVNASGWVQQILETVGLYEILSAGRRIPAGRDSLKTA
jgi:anti-anti-sigma factor